MRLCPLEYNLLRNEERYAEGATILSTSKSKTVHNVCKGGADDNRHVTICLTDQTILFIIFIMWHVCVVHGLLVGRSVAHFRRRISSAEKIDV
jgi:hypothetical protein